MSTLAHALMRSPYRASYAYTPVTHGLVEVRCLSPLLPPSASVVAAAHYRYELATNGTPQIVGSYREVASWSARLGALDWQPVYDRSQAIPTQAQASERPPMAQEG